MKLSASLPWRILADDLTGACDTGAVFAQRGWPVRVALPSRARRDVQMAQVWSSESRGLSESDAIRAVEDVLSGLPAGDSGYFYRKIDSTLRGHPGPELSAVMRWLGAERALVCPAFPAQGRTILGGQVRVSGVPLPDAPELPQLFESGVGCKVVPLDMVRQGTGALAGTFEAPGIYLADAETQADLETLANAGLLAGMRLFCGSAGLARALSGLLQPLTSPQTLTPREGGVLVVAGSRHAVTLRQVSALTAADWRVLPLSAKDNGPLAEPCAAGHHLALTVSGLADQPGSERRIAEGLARWTLDLLKKMPLAGLVLTGGDTAAAVCAALGCTAIDLGGEVQPGLAWGWLADGASAGLSVVTKAGGFGGESALLDATRFLIGAPGLFERAAIF